MTNNFIKKVSRVSSILLMSNCFAAGATSCNNSNVNSLFFTIKTDSGLEVEFCDKGASIYSIKYKDTYITYHPKDKSVFIEDTGLEGRAMGRVCGRIKDGKFKLDGKEYNLELNDVKKDAHNNKNNTLHGGIHSIGSKVFKRQVSELADRYTISFNYFSPAGEAGFPESVDTWFIYSLYKTQPQLDVTIYATPSGRTPLNFTTHPYFRLGNDGDIKSHLLTIPTDTMGKYNFNDKNQIVIGKMSVTDPSVSKSYRTPFDFRTAKEIGKDIQIAQGIDDCSNGYDHMWCTSDGSAIATEANPIILKNEATGIELRVTTDANAAFVYATCWQKEGSVEMNPSGQHVQFGGLAIEPQSYWVKGEDDEMDSNIIYSPERPFTRKISYTLSGK